MYTSYNDDKEKKMNEIHGTTPERKKEYVRQWLLQNPHGTANFDSNSNERTPPTSPRYQERCTASFAHPLSPVLAQRPSTSCTIAKSPILGGKRLASSPIIGGRRRSIKRIKVAKKLDKIYTKENTSSDSKLQTVLQPKTHVESRDHSKLFSIIKFSSKEIFINLYISGNEDIFESNTTVASTVKAKESDLNFTFDDTKSTKQNNIKTNKGFRMVKKPLDDTVSQLIESASSTQDTSTENTEQNIQDANSDSEKTISDLIEDISTQVVLVTPDKCNEMPASQKISNPSISPSPKSETDIHISETTAAEINTNFHSLQTGTPTDQIDTVSTLDSKIDFGLSNIDFGYPTEKPKRKKTYQK